jgi:hypothetical protein
VRRDVFQSCGQAVWNTVWIDRQGSPFFRAKHERPLPLRSLPEVFDRLLPEHRRNLVRLSALADGYPLIELLSRLPVTGVRVHLTTMQDEVAVNYCHLAVVSTDPPEVTAAFRTGLGATFTFPTITSGAPSPSSTSSSRPRRASRTVWSLHLSLDRPHHLQRLVVRRPADRSRSCGDRRYLRAIMHKCRADYE